MKKAWILALVAVFALSGGVLAADLSGSAKIEGTIDLDEDAKFEAITPALTLNLKASEGEVWSADVGLKNADLKKPATATELQGYKLTLTSELLKLTAWGNVNQSDYVDVGNVNDPLEFVVARGDDDATPGTQGIRAESSALGLDLTAQLGGTNWNEAYIFGKTKVDKNTVGGGVKIDSSGAENEYTFVGYVTLPVDPATFDLAVASKNVTGGDNTAYGLKATVTAGEGVTVDGKYAVKGKNFTDTEGATKEDTDYSVGLTYEQATVKASVSFSGGDSEKAEKTSKIEATGYYSGSADNQPFTDDAILDDYYKNVAYAVKGEFSVEDQDDGSANNRTVVGVTYTTPLIPDSMWLKGSLRQTSDKDKDLTVKDGYPVADSLLEAGLDLYHKLPYGLISEPSLSYKKAGDGTSLTLQEKLTYPISDAATLEATLARTTDNNGTKDEVDTTLALGVTVNF